MLQLHCFAPPDTLAVSAMPAAAAAAIAQHRAPLFGHGFVGDGVLDYRVSDLYLNVVHWANAAT